MAHDLRLTTALRLLTRWAPRSTSSPSASSGTRGRSRAGCQAPTEGTTHRLLPRRARQRPGLRADAAAPNPLQRARRPLRSSAPTSAAARERRHLTQRALGGSSGVSKAGLSLIERGVRETSIKTLFELARSLEVSPDVLLQGIAWKPEPSKRQGSRARCPGRSRDDAIRRLWNEDKTAREIAWALGTSPGTVSATVHRLRERGEHVRYRRSPTRAVHERARGRRVTCQSSPPAQPEADAAPEEPAGGDQASNKEIAKRIGENVAMRRAEAGLSLRELEEASRDPFQPPCPDREGEGGRPTVGPHPETGRQPERAVQPHHRGRGLGCGLRLISGSGGATRARTALGFLGENARRARYGLDLSQQALSDIASMSRGDLVDFERGSRNFRIFTVIRLAGALGVLSVSCLPAWRIGISARLPRRNSCPEKRQPKPSATSCLSGSGGKGAQNKR